MTGLPAGARFRGPESYTCAMPGTTRGRQTHPYMEGPAARTAEHRPAAPGQEGQKLAVPAKSCRATCPLISCSCHVYNQRTQILPHLFILYFMARPSARWQAPVRCTHKPFCTFHCPLLLRGQVDVVPWPSPCRLLACPSVHACLRHVFRSRCARPFSWAAPCTALPILPSTSPSSFVSCPCHVK